MTVFLTLGKVHGTDVTPFTVTPDANCADVLNGATITNSWTCRSCIQYHVDFILTSDQLNTIGSEDNFYYELWFSDNVSSSTNHYPVISTVTNANLAKLTFNSNHQWPSPHGQSKVQFDGQLRYDPR